MEKDKKFNHIPVQINKVIDLLNIKPNGVYVDCTFGRGGHSSKILERIKSGKLFVIDQDIEAFKYFQENFFNKKNCYFLKGNFANLKEMLNENKVFGVDGFLFDLGVSSPMFDNPNRGFSYKYDGPLDMRMNQNDNLSASNVINEYEKDDLCKVFKNYGDIKNPLKVVNAIISYRALKKITSTIELVNIIKSCTSKKEIYDKKHFATKYFQALRIEVNNEINNLQKGLLSAISMLNKQGRIVTISFHSLEERMVKKCFLSTQPEKYPKELPINNLESEFKILNIKEKSPDKIERDTNRRSRSSVIKVLERI